MAEVAGLATAVVLAGLTWLVSLVQRDASLADRIWPLMIAGAGWAYALVLPAMGPRALAVLALASLWALRLALFIHWRNHGQGEDRRYQALRARHGPHFGAKSLWLVFGLQAVLAWLVSAPLLAARTAPATFSASAVAGLALALCGLVYEAVADAQLARFRRDPAQRGQVMDRGLWRNSRHPNYFGEACVWWGLWLAVADAGLPGALALVSPLLMTWLLLRVSGVRLLEHDMAERRPAYRDYIARTPAFVPGPRKRVPPAG